MTVREIRDETGLSRAKFSRKYSIPLRTLENWESGHSRCPEYIPMMLEQCITQNLYYLPITGEPIENLRKKIKMSRAEFSREYHIPLRTLEDWDSKKRKPPEYVSEMIERCVRHEKLPFYFCVYIKKNPNSYTRLIPATSGNLIFHLRIMYPCTLENITAENGYENKRKCRDQAKLMRKYNGTKLIYVIRAEDLIDMLLKSPPQS